MSNRSFDFFEIAKKESSFLIFISVLFLLAAFFTPYPQIAMWFGFMVAGYSAIANDSIQTIGTFIASNQRRPWYILWLFMGTIFLVTVTYSWITYSGDVSYERLSVKGFAEAPTEFNYLQLIAPVILIVLTRLRMPVSTTFLLLSAFTTSGGAIVDVLSKSFAGYALAFVCAIIVFFVVSRFVDKYFNKKPGPLWVVFQWMTSGALWSVWIQQDAANIAIFLPRSLSTWEFIAFASYIFFGLGLLFYMKGDKIQGIVNEKSGVNNIRSATVIDLVYAIILYYFKWYSKVPMSTTWVFIGLLGGRELAISLSRKNIRQRKLFLKLALKMGGRDLLFAFIGLVVSLLLAMGVNPDIQKELINIFN